MSDKGIFDRRLAVLVAIVLFVGLGVLWESTVQPPSERVRPGLQIQSGSDLSSGEDSAPRIPEDSPDEDSLADARYFEEDTSVATDDGLVTHPSDALLAVSRLMSQQWSEADAVGNRERAAIYQTDRFKYPLLRVVEKWSGKTGEMVSRTMMVADHLLVAPRPGMDTADFEKRILAEGFAMGGAVGESSMRVSFAARVNDTAELPQRIAMLDEWVEYAEPDYLVWPCVAPNDPAFLAKRQWGFRNSGGVAGYTEGADIDAVAGWAVRNDASGVIVAVTDTGIRYDHRDLASNMWRNPAEVPGDGIDNDGNGVTDDVFGYDAHANDGDPMDDQGHGTHCAGTIGARGNNGFGITGVAWNVQLMAGRFLSPLGGTTSDAIKVIDYARLNGAHIINASWGGGGYSQSLRGAIAACANSGIPFVAAAGNTGTNNDSQPHYPSSYDLPNIVAVAATDATDELTGFSCYGRNTVDIAAPGWQIWSCYARSTSDYVFLQGTSMATPHVSGALALMRALRPAANVEELIGALYQSVDKLASLDGKVTTGGRLNLHGLLTEVGTPPAHDQFITPFILTGDYATWSGSNRVATREADESSYSPASGSRTLWFSWQAPYHGFATVSTSSLGAGQRVVIFRGQSRNNLDVVYDSGDASAATPDTRCSFQAVAGENYRIVTASDSQAGELFALTLEVVGSHDLLSGAFTADGEEFAISGSNRGATAQPFENAAPHAGVGSGHSVWYRWDATFSGLFSLNTEGSGTDTVLAVYTGDPLNPGSFTTVAANDDVSATQRWSRVDINAVQGIRYFFAVDTAMGGQPGGFILRGAVPAPPVITSQPAGLDSAFGTRAILSVGAVGTPPITYQWFKNDEALPGAWENTLLIDPVVVGSLGTYHVVVGNNFGSVHSGDALLSEKRLAPDIVWSTGDVAFLIGQNATLGVRASGSEAMSYIWTKDGESLAGQNQSSLSLPSVTAAAKGVYVCTVTNDEGSASSSMVVSVVSSPFEAFTGVRESAPNSKIASISVIDGKCYAVAGDRIMVSEDGRTWLPWLLPAGFDGSALAKHDGKWYCPGYRLDGALSMAISLDGNSWQSPVAITGFTAPYGGHTPISQLVSVGGRLVAGQTPVNDNGTWRSAGIYHSTDGINWTQSRERKTNNSLVALHVKCRFALWNGKLYASGYDPNSYASRVVTSTDGVTWRETLLPLNGSGLSYFDGKSIGVSGGRLRMVCTTGTYSTSDGVNWIMDGDLPDNDDQNSRIMVSTGGDIYAFSTWDASPTYLRGASTTTWSTAVANPSGQNFSAAAEFDGAVIVGTTGGLLRRIERPEDFSGTPETIHPLSRIEFLNDEFIAYRTGTNGSEGYLSAPGPILISGDGRNWRAGKSFTTTNLDENLIAKVFLGGRYLTDGNAGFIPAAMTKSGLPAGVKGVLAAATDGTRWLAVGTSEDVYSVTLDGTEWTPYKATGLWAAENASLVHFKGRWFLSNIGNNGSASVLYRSENGIAWSTEASIAAGPIAVFNEKLYALNHSGSILYESADGIAWSSFPTGIKLGAPRNHPSAARVTTKRLLVFDGKLITLVTADYADRAAAFFSENARNWFSGNVPSTLRDIAVGKGTLVGVMANGSVLASGGGAAGAAPITRLTSPAHQSTQAQGNTFEIRGNSVDPEGQPITTECFVDGVSIGIFTGQDFRFSFRAANTKGHIVSVRSRDPAGMVGSDEIMVFSSIPQLRNDLESADGKSQLPQVAWTSFGGRAYVAGEYSLYRTRDDGLWESVLLPSLPGAITNLVSGNGALILQTQSATFVTRDGVVWSQLYQPRGGMISYQGGYFVTYQPVQSGPSLIAFSEDGMSWTSNPSPSTQWSSPTVTPGGSLLVAPPHRSVDGGTNWIPMQQLGNADLQFASAFGSVFAGLSDGRVLRSNDDGRSWQQVAQFDALPEGHQVRLAWHAGILFWGGGGHWMGGSDNGNVWRMIGDQPMLSTQVVKFYGGFVAFGRSGMLWSADGQIWQPAEAGPMNSVPNMLAEDGDSLLLGDTNGGVWRTHDGRTWIQEMPGRPSAAIPASLIDTSGGSHIQIGNTTVFGGSSYNSHWNTFLWHSANDGLDWEPSRFHGGSFSGVTINKMWSNGTIGYASTSRNLPEGNTFHGLWSSANGRDWQQVWKWPGGGVADIQFHGNECWVLGTNGELHRSADNGESWSGDMRPPSLRSGRALIRFDGVWIAIGTEAAYYEGPNVMHVSNDGQSWIKNRLPEAITAGSALHTRAQGTNWWSWAATAGSTPLRIAI